ncbi:hypothetical protein [Bacillus sp. V5-8f]|uniref:hypothetical protein n=1 Tax=Bacillus sp. V5-8f TaxID=2053044 RepID=UPI0015E10900|nr:hypothetical protein [Bacillus sp. V5-8f]
MAAAPDNNQPVALLGILHDTQLGILHDIHLDILVGILGDTRLVAQDIPQIVVAC